MKHSFFRKHAVIVNFEKSSNTIFRWYTFGKFYVVKFNYSRRPLFRVPLISNVRSSEQNFKFLEVTLRYSYNLCCLFRTPLFRTFRYFERFFRPLTWVPSFNSNFYRKMVKNALFLLQLQIFQYHFQVSNKCSEFYLFWLPLFHIGMISFYMLFHIESLD